MLRDLEILNIDYSAADASYRKTESHKVSDLDGRILIPYEGPMFARNLVVRADGSPLTIEKDYTFEDDYEELELMTGKKVIGSLRFSAKVINDYKEIKIVYQKVADIFVSREYLLDSIDKIVNNDTEVDWLTQVFAKADSYAPSAHAHNVLTTDEMVGFSDLVILFKQARGNTTKSGKTLWNKLKTIEDKYFTSMNSTYTKLWNKIFTHIMSVNNPHGVTKSDLELGKHPNYATATLAQHYDASQYNYDEQNKDADGNPTGDKLASNVITTPAGLRYALDQFEQKTDGVMKQGAMPFSYYGSAFYIPPSISGSFEGLGTNTSGGAICMESNGKTVLLTRGFDSKVRQLYYYVNDNIFGGGKFAFSGYTYQSQLMANNGHTPNHCLSGSNERILVVGDREQNQYYICLANGTLDANSHNLVKMNMGSFVDVDGVNLWHPDTSFVILIGDYVYIICSDGSNTNNAGWPSGYPDEDKDIQGVRRSWRRCAFFRINKTDLDGSKTEVNFVRQKMSYHNSERQWLSNQDNVNFCKDVYFIDTDGKKKLKRCVINFKYPPSAYWVGEPWRRQYFTVEDPSRKNVGAMRIFHNVRWSYGTNNISQAGDWFFCLPYEFDANNNTLTLDERFFFIERDELQSKSYGVPEGRDRNEWYHDNISSFCTGHSDESATWAGKLGYCGLTSNVRLMPYHVILSPMGLDPNNPINGLNTNNEYELINQNTLNLGSFGRRNDVVPMDSPFGFTSKPNSQRDLWYYNGAQQSLPLEIFCALNTNGQKALWYRETKDSAEYKPGEMFNFKYISKTIYGRPPSTKFGKVLVNGREQTISARSPCVFINSRDKYSVQYGICTLSSHNVTDKIPNGKPDRYDVGGPINYDWFRKSHLIEEGWNLTLLADHTYNPDTSTLTVTPIKEETVHVTKTILLSFLKFMLGEYYSEICTEETGGENGGEWMLTLFFAAGGYPSIAMLFWHRFSDPKPAYGAICEFTWEETGTNDEGVKEIKIISQRFPSDRYQPGNTQPFYSSFSIGNDWKWGFTADYSPEICLPVLFMDYKDKENYALYLSSGVSVNIQLNASGDALLYRVENGEVKGIRYDAQGRYNGQALPNTYQLIDGYGLTVPQSMGNSGGAAMYVAGGDVPADVWILMQAVFIEGNWTLFVNTEVSATFNGAVKVIGRTSYDLSELGVSYKNQTFYLYAVSGKTRGYYDLTKSKRTASPYQLLAAVIRTNAFGIEEIKVEQRFAISGFSITTANRGGSIPATSGTFPEEGVFEAVVIDDLFDTSTY